MTIKETLVTAAGGNGTVIRVLGEPMDRADYVREGKAMGQAWEKRGAEQAGFLVFVDKYVPSHFEMAGGEFCGNASRAAALLLAETSEDYDPTFTVSGFKGTVHASVQHIKNLRFMVRCTFPGMSTDVQAVTLDNGTPAFIVDLGGIVHVVIEEAFPSDRDAYEQAHRSIMEQFGLGEREAVGVIWFENRDGAVYMHPVVWVNAVDTFFYEESCGSGTIAVGKVTGQSAIVQPTGQTITAVIAGQSVSLESEMEIIS